MISLEQEIKNYLSSRSIPFVDNSDSYDKLDFTIGDKPGKVYHIDAKEKRQRYNPASWGIHPHTEPYAMIIDDLAHSKIVGQSPRSGIIVRDNVRGGYYWYNVLDLCKIEKTRANRAICRNGVTYYKGKIILDLRHALCSDTLHGAFDYIRAYERNRKYYFTKHHECYGKYFGEVIPTLGQTRKPEHWNEDILATR